MYKNSKTLFLAIVTVIIVFASANLYYLYFAAVQADNNLNDQNRKAVSAYLDGYQSEHLNKLQGLSVSSRLFDELKSESARDARAQVCDSIHVRDNVFALVIMDHSGRIMHHCEYGRLENNRSARWLVGYSENIIATMNSEIGKLFSKYKSIVPEFRNATQFSQIDNEHYWLAGSQIVPAEIRQKEEDLRQFYLLTFINVDRVIFRQMSDTLPVEGLALQTASQIEPNMRDHMIKVSDNADNLAITWKQSGSYTEMFKSFIPVMLAISALFIFAALYYLWRIAQMQKQIVQSEHEAVQASMHDAMTGLPNRKYFNEKLFQALSMVTPDHPVFVGILDLDSFKQINDTYGHDTGDEMIITAANRLRKILGPENFSARLGGDEFSFIVKSCASAKRMSKLASQLSEAMKWPVVINEVEHWPSASIGICECPRHAMNSKQALKNADHALYVVKDNGRAGFHILKDADLFTVQENLSNKVHKFIPKARTLQNE